MISHRNVITNVLQIMTFELESRKARGKNDKLAVDVVLGLLPQSHIYGLVVISFAATWRGGKNLHEKSHQMKTNWPKDQVIILPKFDLDLFLKSIEK